MIENQDNKKLIEEYLNKLKPLTKNDDCENAHVMADSIICDLLVDLGFKRIVEEYAKIEKWYA